MNHEPFNIGQWLFERFDDRLNPILVREIRQAVQGRFVVGVFLFVLTIQLVALGIFLIINHDISTKFDAGQDLFIILQGILLGTCLVFVPAYTGFRLASERSDTNVDLLFISTLRPRAIIAGKILAAIALTAVILSACLPFMSMTYFLRGIDLPSIFILLALNFLVVVTAIQLAVFIACLPVHKVFKVFFGLAGFGGLVMMFAGTIAATYGLLSIGVGSLIGSWSFWGAAGTIIGIGLMIIGLLFSLSVALITPLSANRSLPVRIYLTVIWLVTGVTATIWSLVQRNFLAIDIWAVLSITLLCITLFAAVSERESLGRRVARTIPGGGLRRMLSFLFYSGGANGVIWAGLLMGLTVAIAFAWDTIVPLLRTRAISLRENTQVMAGMGLYALSYVLSALYIRRWFLSHRISPKYTWLMALILLVVGSVVPFLIGALFLFDQWQGPEDAWAWLVSNPFALLLEQYRSFYLVFAGVWAVIATLMNYDWFIGQIKGFRPYGISLQPPIASPQPEGSVDAQIIQSEAEG